MERDYEAIIIYYLIINILLFIIMLIDKKRAIKNKWRIRENTIFIISLMGGFIGGFLGMQIFRHKNRKIKFYFVFIGSFFIHTIACYLILKVF